MKHNETKEKLKNMASFMQTIISKLASKLINWQLNQWQVRVHSELPVLQTTVAKKRYWSE